MLFLHVYHNCTCACRKEGGGGGRERSVYLDGENTKTAHQRLRVAGVDEEESEGKRAGERAGRERAVPLYSPPHALPDCSSPARRSVAVLAALVSPFPLLY